MLFKENEFRIAKPTYQEAFPKVERMPMWMVKCFTRPKTSAFYTVYEGAQYVGLVDCVYWKDLLYILYFAIDQNLRGKGYGGRILQEICSRYAGYRIILCAEEVDQSYSNYEQWRSRMQFYERNGFQASGEKLKEAGVVYDILCYHGCKVEKTEYFSLFRNYLGNFLYHVVYRKIAE